MKQRYNMIIYTQDKDQLDEINKRLSGLTYACKLEKCQDIDNEEV